MINGKFSSITDFIQSIEDIVNSDLGKVFLIPFIYGAAGLCIYLIKKRLEKNRIAEYNQLADLHKKLNDNETSIKALDHLRDTIEKKVRNRLLAQRGNMLNMQKYTLNQQKN